MKQMMTDTTNFESDMVYLKRKYSIRKAAAAAEFAQKYTSISRKLEITGRFLIAVSFEPVTFGVGVILLALRHTAAMNFGHMSLHSAFKDHNAERYAWEVPILESAWQVSHNKIHHNNNGLIGKDPDITFTIFRTHQSLPWSLVHLAQPLFLMLLIPRWSQVMGRYSCGLNDKFLHVLSNTTGYIGVLRQNVTDPVELDQLRSKHRKLLIRELLFYPLIIPPLAVKIALGNLLALAVHNSIMGMAILAGHWQFASEALDPHSDRSRLSTCGWYERQVRATATMPTNRFLNLILGGIDYHIEHHLFPSFPPNLLREMSKDVRQICQKHGIPYRSKGFIRSTISVACRVLRYALPF